MRSLLSLAGGNRLIAAAMLEERARVISIDGVSITSEMLGRPPSMELLAWRAEIRRRMAKLRIEYAARNGGAQRPDKARQLDRNAVLGPAGAQAGGFPSPRGGGRGEGANAYGAALLHT